MAASTSSRRVPALEIRRLRRRAAAPMLIVFAVISTIYMAIVATVVATDPYDIYPWGVQLHVEESDTPRDLVVNWIDVVNNNPALNTFVVGSSVTAMYSPEDVQSLLGNDARVFNLSYGGPRPKDRDVVLDRLKENQYAKHIILTFDWMYISRPDLSRDSFPEFLYDRDITNDLRMVNLDAVRATLNIFRGDRVYENPDDQHYANYIASQYRDFHSPGSMSALAKLIETYRPAISKQSGKTCADFPAITEQLIPDLREFSRKGVKVDILMPIMSYAVYYSRQSEISPTLLDEYLIARRCLVEAVGDLPNIRIFAFDHKPEIAGDLSHFRDPGHVYNPAILRQFMGAIVNDTDRLTRENLDRHEQTIRSAVATYRLVNTNHLQRRGTHYAS